MHRYDRAILQDWHPAWLLAPICIWVIILMIAYGTTTAGEEPGVRHALPDPYVPECYSTEWRSGHYCEIRPIASRRLN